MMSLKDVFANLSRFEESFMSVNKVEYLVLDVCTNL